LLVGAGRRRRSRRLRSRTATTTRSAPTVASTAASTAMSACQRLTLAQHERRTADRQDRQPEVPSHCNSSVKKKGSINSLVAKVPQHRASHKGVTGDRRPSEGSRASACSSCAMLNYGDPSSPGSRACKGQRQEMIGRETSWSDGSRRLSDAARWPRKTVVHKQGGRKHAAGCQCHADCARIEWARCTAVSPRLDQRFHFSIKRRELPAACRR
jgi:hypothetical protein